MTQAPVDPAAADVALRPVALPAFGTPTSLPAIPAESYAARALRLVARAGTDWVVVYADREHAANMLFLTGFEPRFEEALVVLGRDGRRAILLGNETMDYAVDCRLPGARLLLAQSLSLMGQDRSRAPSLVAALLAAGLAAGQSVGLAGWKYPEAGEFEGFVVPHHIVAALAAAVGGAAGIRDVTRCLMDPADGERTINDADQIAVFEWAAARASEAVWRILAAARPGMTEAEAAAAMGYAGEPLSCHVMMSSTALGPAAGLRSPRAVVMPGGAGVTTAVGYWGGLSARAGMLSDAAAAAGFLDRARGYFAALCAWYGAAGIGATGGEICARVTARLAACGLRPALNPGHLASYDEWSHSPVQPASAIALRSGMVLQVDVIPVPLPAGQMLNCEDAVAIADAALCRDIAARHPAAWARIEARRRFLAEAIGLALKPEILPLSNTPLCLPPDWSRPGELFTLAGAPPGGWG